MSVPVWNLSERETCEPSDLPEGSSSHALRPKPEGQRYIRGEAVYYVCEDDTSPVDSDKLKVTCKGDGTWQAGNLRCVHTISTSGGESICVHTESMPVTHREIIHRGIPFTVSEIILISREWQRVFMYSNRKHAPGP